MEGQEKQSKEGKSENEQDPPQPDDVPSFPPTSSTPSPPTISLPIPLATHETTDTDDFVGTPFGYTSSPFEYPFPDPTGSTSPSDFPASPPSVFVTRSPLPAPPYTIAAIPPRPRSPTLTHPKLRSASPPVPPSLVRKRARYSLGQLTRRRSGSVDSGYSAVSSASTSSFSDRKSSILDLRQTPSFASLLGSSSNKPALSERQSSFQAIIPPIVGEPVVEMRRAVSSPDVIPKLTKVPSEDAAEDTAKEDTT
ncbi:hypothetical protein BDV98DRAFT_563374 [Pterulicium gracile]|uniref:Uncharacterized protein n=1 Tax=Pterulicium gracile TaxID=1884261 RepID=A0A5C3QUH8_9AGAR|nr:hypothetical protein BDV98DRAFT_563374 [Pterula gracilis]